MQKKLERLDIIIRDTYASGEFIFEEYIEATELLTKLSNELKILNIPYVIKAEGGAVCDCVQPEPSGKYTELRHICCNCKRKIAN